METYERAFISEYGNEIPFKTLEQILSAFNYFVNNNTDASDKIMKQ